MAKLSDPAGYLKEHYGYELWMLRELHDCMRSPLIFQAMDRVSQNAFIEAFCIHARALSDFYAMPHSDNPKNTDITAEYFCCGFRLAISGGADAFKIKVNKQIAHLTQQRASAEKIDIGDVRQARTAIEREHCRFRHALSSELAALIPPCEPAFANCG